MNKTIAMIGMVILMFPFTAGYREIWDIYYPKDSTIEAMKSMCGNLDFCRYSIIGKSIRGKDIYLFDMGNREGTTLLMDGSMHGWEDSGTVWMMEFMEQTSRQGTSEYSMMQKYRILMIPIVNMDTTDRGNGRTYNPDGSRVYYGVDLNRNFADGWGETGSSDATKPWPVTYRGYKAASEPETRAVMQTMEQYRPDAYINWHMGGTRTWAGCGDSGLMQELGFATGCNGGFAVQQARAYGAKLSLYTETTDSNHIPNTKDQLLDLFYEEDLKVVQKVLELASDEAPASTTEQELLECRAEISRLQMILDAILKLLK